VTLDELTDALDDIAEPRVADVRAARVAVQRRVRRARVRRAAAAGACTALVAAAAVVVALDSGGSTPSIHTEGPASAPRTALCNQIPLPVPRADVPADVAQWSGDTEVIGSGALWTIRSATAVAPIPLDGGWYLKFPWDPRPTGLPVITGRRLDGPGTFYADVNAATDSRGTWAVSGLNFSTAGCWQITARYAGSELTFNLAAGQTPEAGPLPLSDAGGPLDEAKVPDYVETSDRDGNIVGYTRKADLFAAAGATSPTLPVSKPTPVYALDDLDKVVGHMYPARGFVRLGQDPADVPTIPVHTPAG
jgi:hypothetical protein